MMPKMCEKGELVVKYTNHSLRATSASRLFAIDVPEKIIQGKSGHRSLAGLRTYETTTVDQQQRRVTKILGSSEATFALPDQILPEMPCPSNKENCDENVPHVPPTVPLFLEKYIIVYLTFSPNRFQFLFFSSLVCRK